MIAHFDVDAFYASVAVPDDPTLRGKPVAVAGSSRRAVVLTASYEARPFGVRSAMPLYKALDSCPNLVVVRPDMRRYRETSHAIFTIFAQRGTAVEGLSLDEAFVDLAACSLDAALRSAQEIRDEVLRATQLTVSAGVAEGKMIAKMLSDSCKPNGLRGLAPGEEAAFLAPLPVGSLWGVGPKTQSRLAARDINLIGDVAALDDVTARALFGAWGIELRDRARGIDRRTVDPGREIKSVSTEETFEYDIRDERMLREIIRSQALELAQKLEREGLCAATIGVKIKRGDFRIVVRQTNLVQPTMDARTVYRAAVHCLARAQLRRSPVRLIGTRVASLVSGEPKQEALFGT